MIPIRNTYFLKKVRFPMTSKDLYHKFLRLTFYVVLPVKEGRENNFAIEVSVDGDISAARPWIFSCIICGFVITEQGSCGE